MDELCITLEMMMPSEKERKSVYFCGGSGYAMYPKARKNGGSKDGDELRVTSDE